MVGYIYAATAVVKFIAGALFLGGYLKSKRKSALFLSLGWISAPMAAPPHPGTALYRYEPFILGISASLTLIGVMYLIEEETGRKPPASLRFSIPSIPMSYGFIESVFGSGSCGTYVVVGILIMVAGVLSCELLKDRYDNNGRIFGTVLSIIGAISALRPTLYRHFHLSTRLSAELSLAIAVIMAVAYYRVILSPRFVNVENFPELTVQDLKRGTMIVSPEEFHKITPILEDYPALAFLRGEPAGKGWIVYRLQTIEGQRTIHPRNIYKILEYSNRYLREMGDKNRGIVILDSPEFLRIYNDFPSVVKTLTSLSDMVRARGGTLIIVTVPETWEEKEWEILKRTVT